MNKNLKKILIALIAIVVLAIILLPKILSSSEGGKNTSPGARADIIVPVKAHIASLENISNRVLATGTVLANEEVELRSEISGQDYKNTFQGRFFC